MRLGLWMLLVLACTLHTAICWPCTKTNASVNDLPGFNHTYEFPCMYSGLVEIDPSVDASIFYWFFLSKKPDYATKTVLWFNGGPGASGEKSIIEDNGPIKVRVDEDGAVEVYSDIESSFADVANVIYVDQPLGVGYSNSQQAITSGKQIGDYMVKFMLEFYKLYPEQRLQELIIGGNSYGGHFMPPVVKAIQEYNSKTADASQNIPLVAVMVEDGYVDPVSQRLSIKDLAFASGLVSADLLGEYEILEQHCETSFYASPETAFETCKEINSFMADTDGGWEIMDIRYPTGKTFVPNTILTKYFSTKEVQEQLHVLKHGKTIHYSSYNTTVYRNMNLDGAVDYTDAYNDIVNSGIKTMVIAGSLDNLDGVTGTERWVSRLNITSQLMFINTRKNVYYYTDADNTEQVGGTFKNYVDRNQNTLSLVVVYAGGHVLGHTQLHVTKALLADLISSGQAVCHRQDGSCDIRSKICQHMNSCNHNGQCIDGICQCGYGVAFGADCSIVPSDLTAGSYELYPREWRYFKAAKELGSFTLDLKTSDGSEVHVYHKVEFAPSRSNFDGLKKAPKMKYAIDETDKFTIIAIHNPSSSRNTTVEVAHDAKYTQAFVSL